MGVPVTTTTATTYMSTVGIVGGGDAFAVDVVRVWVFSTLISHVYVVKFTSFLFSCPSSWLVLL
jgi:hypothetical protein